MTGLDTEKTEYKAASTGSCGIGVTMEVERLQLAKMARGAENGCQGKGDTKQEKGRKGTIEQSKKTKEGQGKQDWRTKR